MSLIIKRQKLVPRREVPKYTGAIFETAGQFAYIYALADTRARRPRRADHLGLLRGVRPAGAASSSRKSSPGSTISMIVFVVAGIVLLGMYDE